MVIKAITLANRKKIELEYDIRFLTTLAKEAWEVLTRNKPQIIKDKCRFDEVGCSTTLDLWVAMPSKYEWENSHLGEVKWEEVIRIVGLTSPDKLKLTKDRFEGYTVRTIEFQKLLVKGLWDAYLFACRERDN